MDSELCFTLGLLIGLALVNFSSYLNATIIKIIKKHNLQHSV